MLELGATFFNWSFNKMLYDMTFSQLLSMITTRNNREIEAHERAEKEAARNGQGSRDKPPPADDKPAPLQNVERMFGKLSPEAIERLKAEALSQQQDAEK